MDPEERIWELEQKVCRLQDEAAALFVVTTALLGWSVAPLGHAKDTLKASFLKAVQAQAKISGSDQEQIDRLQARIVALLDLAVG